MRPVALHARQFRTYETLDVTFGDGMTAILGEIRDGSGGSSNGAGKTSILEAIDIALFGRRSLAPYGRRGQPDDLLLELEFEHAGQTYRVRRSYSQAGRGKPTFDFEERLSDGWEPLTCASIAATQDAVCDTIGLSRDTYRHSSYLRQQSRSFADESVEPRERKRLLTEAVLGRTPVWAARLEQARAEKSALTAKDLLLAAQIDQAREQAVMLPGLEQEHESVVEAETVSADNVADLERSRLELAQEYQAAREHAARRTAAEAELREAEQECKRLDDLAVRAGAAATLIGEARKELEQLSVLPLDELEATRTVLEGERAAYRTLAATRAQAQQEHDRAAAQQREAEQTSLGLVARAGDLRLIAGQKREAEDATCQTCGQHIANEAKQRAVAELEQLAVECEAKAAECDRVAAERAVIVAEGDQLLAVAAKAKPPDETVYAATVEAIAAAQAAQAKRAALDERIRQAEQTLAEIPDNLASQETLADGVVAGRTRALAAVGEPPNLAAIELRGNEVSEQLAGARASLEQHRTMRARLDERITVARDAAAQLQAAAKERQNLEHSLDVVAALERAYNPNGVPALILENRAIPYLEVTANRVLADLGCPYTIELRTQAENKTGGLRDTLDVIVVDENGDTALFEEGTSGGEKTRIGLALRIGLARLLGGSGLLALDEPGDLDEAGMAALVQVLRELQNEFALILLVSHVPTLRDSFDQVLTVVKTDGRSTVTDGHTTPVDPQAVAA